MEFLLDHPVLAISIASVLSNVLAIVKVALGLGLVIFFHELGHFAVAKWCNVHVERFSIGFGPILWSRKKGETEYALSLIPFGGYVKMLGQDDMDPSQLSSEEIARDPRSYSAKSVPQRMAIISAGVVMNVLTGMIMVAIAFGLGIEAAQPVVGFVLAGEPAWVAGIEPGDRITQIDNRQVSTFPDIVRGVILSTNAVTVRGVHRDGGTYEVAIEPDGSGQRRTIGAASAASLQIGISKDDLVAAPGSPAAAAVPAFQGGDIILAADGNELADYFALQDYLAKHRDAPVSLLVARKGAEGTANTTEKIELKPQAFRRLGLWVDIGEIAAIQNNSPAANAGLQTGDKLAQINGKMIGTDIDPIRLPDILANLAGQDVEIVVSRPIQGADPKDVTVKLKPEAKAGWTDWPDVGVPLAIPSIGVAYHLIPAVLKVEPNSPADQAKVQVGEQIVRMELVPSADAKAPYDKSETIEFKDSKNKVLKNWAHAFWKLQNLPTHSVKLTVADKLGVQRSVAIVPQPADDWFVPDTRGIRFTALTMTQKANSVGEAFTMGVRHTKDTIIELYLTLRSFITGLLSYKEIHGPVGIAMFAYKIAQQGMAELLLFLGFLSLNLAVLNFLPIPVLDGGHIVFLLWEAITRKKPSERVLVAATYFGMAFVLGLMILALYLDVVVHQLGIN